MQKMKADEAAVERIVNDNDKKRFQLTEKDGVKLIRAVQGHSIKTVETEELLQPLKNPFQYNRVIHGTYLEPLPLIFENGLNRM